MDTSLLSRELALEKAAVEALEGDLGDPVQPSEVPSGLLPGIGGLLFDATGLDVFLAFQASNNAALWESQIEATNSEIAVAEERLVELNGRLLSLEIEDCLNVPFFQGLRPKLELDADSSPSRAENRAINACFERKEQTKVSTERAIAVTQDEISNLNARLGAEATQSQASSAESERAERSRQVVVSLAYIQSETATLNAIIAILSFTIAVLAVVFTPAGSQILGTTFLLLCLGIGLPLMSVPPSQLALSFIVMNAVAAFSVLLILYALRLFLLHNAELWHVLTRQERVRVGTTTLAYWTFPGALLVGGLILSNSLDKHAMDFLYRQNVDVFQTGLECEPENRLLHTATGYDTTCIQRRLEQDVQRSIRSHFNAAQANVLNAVDELTDETLSTADWAQITANRVVDDTLPHQLARSRCLETECTYVSPIFDIETGCNFFNVMCHGKNWGKHRARAVYDGSRSSTAKAVEDILQSASSVANQSAEEVRAAARAEIKGVIDASIVRLDRLAWTVFRINEVLRFLAAFCLSIAVLKTLGYILIRVIHHQDGINERLGQRAELPRSVPSEPFTDRITYSDHEGILRIPGGETYCLAKSASLQGAQSHIFQPIPSIGLFISRLLSWPITKIPNHILNRYKTDGVDEVKISSLNNWRLIAIRLEDGEELAFNTSSFIGMTSSVRLKVKWGFRTTDLMASRIRRPHAIGAGYVIFITQGAVQVSEALPTERKPSFVGVSRMVAWVPGAPYQLDSQKIPIAMYAGTVGVAPATRSGLIFADGGRPTSVQFGLIRTIMLLLPL
ncbi:hypothetical protein [Roseovarius sp. EL26]|uniref:hypothetical protein n=1 Tax=Roseovarius sp. EL26 TaxID=2126672 RepID=UPI0013C3F412|nr:hypothetical protein [Roseovarius sp. EL26]